MDPLQEYLAKPWLKFYPQGVPPTVEIEPKPVFQLFDEAAARWPKREALVFYGRGITYGELHDAADRLASALDLGVKKGDRVALYLVNCPQFVIAYFAALKCGAAVTSISPLYTSHEVRYQLEDSGAGDRLPGPALREGGEVRGAARRHHCHRRRRVPARAQAAVREEDAGAADPLRGP